MYNIIASLGCILNTFLCADQVCGDVRFLERREGESVTLPCEVGQRNPSPFGVYLRRSWLRPGKVLFMYTKSDFNTDDNDDKARISVSGDPSGHSVNVTLSQLRASDTDRYYCEFVVENPSSEDDRVPGKTEYFLLVSAGELQLLLPPLHHTHLTSVCHPREVKNWCCCCFKAVKVEEFNTALIIWSACLSSFQTSMTHSGQACCV